MASGSISRVRLCFKLPCVHLKPSEVLKPVGCLFQGRHVQMQHQDSHEGTEFHSTPGLFLADKEGALKILCLFVILSL